MSGEARPISPTRFASALTELPTANLYGKAFEIRNSIAHLERSNAELQTYSDSVFGGDADCQRAIAENETVIERMKERIALVKAEVERRGQRWHEAGEVAGEAEEAKENGHTNGAEVVVNGVGEAGQEVEGGSYAELARGQNESAAGSNNDHERTNGGRLSDEELRRQLLDRMNEDDGEGMYL